MLSESLPRCMKLLSGLVILNLHGMRSMYSGDHEAASVISALALPDVVPHLEVLRLFRLSNESDGEDGTEMACVGLLERKRGAVGDCGRRAWGNLREVEFGFRKEAKVDIEFELEERAVNMVGVKLILEYFDSDELDDYYDE
ncbi:hypothetical protein NMY22_g10294 [Coprinellus aureogranulatus]|nr:hypothetical protein NMY22_g10294 [Coprinellus aureogranulatus]